MKKNFWYGGERDISIQPFVLLIRPGKFPGGKWNKYENRRKNDEERRRVREKNSEK